MDRITVGQPINHTEISLRDAKGRMVPLGTIGEICIHGKGLALGYYGRPELTADKFRYDQITGDRYYTTGDLGRYLPDGSFECLGRVDHQVKVRGFRIELSDIETHLRSLPGVKEVLVLAVKGDDGDARLVAYWVGPADRDSLHLGAKSRLPYYMVPSAYIHLEFFPLNTSGKVDRKQLPSAESIEDDLGTSLLPRTDEETIVASVWREVLGIPVVPIDKDFFSLGGTSISAILMQSKLKSSLGINLPLRVLFDHPTVEGIVAQMDSSESPDAPVVSLLSKGPEGLPWIGLMGINLFEDLAREFKSSHGLLAMHVPVRFVPGVDPFPTVAMVAKRYIEVIKKHQPEGPYYLLGLCHGGIVAFEAAVQLQESGDQVPLVVLLDAELPSAKKINLLRYLRYGLGNLFRRVLAFFIQKVTDRGMNSHLTSKTVHNPVQKRSTTGSEAIDLPLDDPEVDRDVLRYESMGRSLKSDVMVFRATQSERSPWLEIRSDLGWGGRAANVLNIDIPANHLGILRDGAAAELAKYMISARKSKK